MRWYKWLASCSLFQLECSHQLSCRLQFKSRQLPLPLPPPHPPLILFRRFPIGSVDNFRRLKWAAQLKRIFISGASNSQDLSLSKIHIRLQAGIFLTAANLLASATSFMAPLSEPLTCVSLVFVLRFTRLTSFIHSTHPDKHPISLLLSRFKFFSWEKEVSTQYATRSQTGIFLDLFNYYQPFKIRSIIWRGEKRWAYTHARSSWIVAWLA